MRFTTSRDSLFKALQAVVGVVEKRQTMPILSNLLLKVSNGELEMTATDLELELINRLPVEESQDGAAAVPARKLFDICRGLPEGSNISFELNEQRATLRSGRSRFVLATMSPDEYPLLEGVNEGQQFEVPRDGLRKIMDRTHFAMAHQDVRYYLNGLLIEVKNSCLRAVATDGHRLALSELELDTAASEILQIIVPRKAITELQRLMDEGDEQLKLFITSNHLRVQLGAIRFTTKLIDGRFPDYERVIPEEGDKLLQVDRETVRQALIRTAILSNEKFRGVRITLAEARLRLQAQNPDHEEAEEDLEVDYSGSPIEIGFNVNYLLDALGAMEGEQFTLELSSPDSSGLIRDPADGGSRYVVMPMRL